MAVFHLSAKMVSRGTGGSAGGAAAYAAAEKVKDHETGAVHDYTDKPDVVYSAILLPPGAPEWMREREALWNAVEARENASTRPESAQLARQVEVALPRELSRSENIELARAFAVEQFVERGMVVDLNLHEPVSERDGELQPHAHMLLTLREVTPEGFGTKVREWNDRALVPAWREAWAEHVNLALERAGVAERVDHRSLEAQGIDRIPEPKIGAAAQAMERRGEVSERGERFREVQALNAERAQERAHVPAHEAGSRPVEHVQSHGIEHGGVDHDHGQSHEAGHEAGHAATAAGLDAGVE